MGAGQHGRQLPGLAGARSQPLSRTLQNQGHVRVSGLSPSGHPQASSPEYTRWSWPSKMPSWFLSPSGSFPSSFPPASVQVWGPRGWPPAPLSPHSPRPHLPCGFVNLDRPPQNPCLAAPQQTPPLMRQPLLRAPTVADSRTGAAVLLGSSQPSALYPRWHWAARIIFENSLINLS